MQIVLRPSSARERLHHIKLWACLAISELPHRLLAGELETLFSLLFHRLHHHSLACFCFLTVKRGANRLSGVATQLLAFAVIPPCMQRPQRIYLTQRPIALSQHCLCAPSLSFLVATPLHHGHRFAARGPCCAAGVPTDAEAAAARPKRGRRGPAGAPGSQKVCMAEHTLVLARRRLHAFSCTQLSCV